MAHLEEKLLGFDEWKKKNGKSLKSASGRVANVSKRGGEYLHEAAERVLNEHFNKQGVRYLGRLRRTDMAAISADQNSFCMMNPAHQHNEPQSDILIDTTSLCMTIHCFGKDCDKAMLALRSVEDLTVLRLAALSKIPYEVLGEPLTLMTVPSMKIPCGDATEPAIATSSGSGLSITREASAMAITEP